MHVHVAHQHISLHMHHTEKIHQEVIVIVKICQQNCRPLYLIELATESVIDTVASPTAKVATILLHSLPSTL